MDADGFTIGQKAAIMEGGKYLLVRRSPGDRTSPGTWEFPGGKLESGEKAEAGLRREMLEETGLSVKVVKPLLVLNHSSRKDFLFIIYECRRLSGRVRLSSEHTEHRWVTRQEMAGLELSDYMKAFLGES
jgi:8-oxo-dGTP diphosphatase